MNHLTVVARKPLSSNSVIAGSRRLQEIRFVAGIAIAIGGAGVLLSDLIHVMPSLG